MIWLSRSGDKVWNHAQSIIKHVWLLILRMQEKEKDKMIAVSTEIRMFSWLKLTDEVLSSQSPN